MKSRIVFVDDQDVRHGIIDSYYRITRHERAMDAYASIVAEIIKRGNDPHDPLQDTAHGMQDKIADDLDPKRGAASLLEFLPTVTSKIKEEINKLKDC